MSFETFVYIPKWTVIKKDWEKIYYDNDLPIQLTQELVNLIINTRESTPMSQNCPTIIVDLATEWWETIPYEIRADSFKFAH